MQAETNNSSLESDSLIEKIIEYTNKGLTDSHIGQLLGKHYKTIEYHRKKHGIESGRSHQARLSARSRSLTMNKRLYKMLPVQESSPGGKTKHGLNSYAPIICRGTRCPYRKTCDIHEEDLSTGTVCVKEAAIIMSQYQKYCKYFRAKQRERLKVARINQLVDIEVKLIRCNRLMAVEPAVYIIEDKYGNSHNELNPVCRYELLLLEEHSKVIKDLRSMTGII
jgi:hypothetical protein